MTTPVDVLIPSFDFSAFYYPQLLEALFAFKRINCPEMTEESAQEPLVQMMRMIALVGHLNNTLIDLVANESTLPTAQLESTVRNMLRLIDYELQTAAPAQADIILELDHAMAVQTEVVPAFAQVSTQPFVDSAARVYEVLEAYLVDASNVLTKVFSVEDNGAGPVYIDRTTAANTGAPFSAWSTALGGSNARAGDSLLFGHAQVMWNQVDFTLSTPASGIVGVWEYYNGNPLKTAPTSITNNGATLTINLTSYLGAANRQGTPIRVYLNASGVYEDLFSYFSGGVNKVDTIALLGQSVPSVIASDYMVGSVWEPFSSLVDGTAGLTGSGAIGYTLPQTLTENWNLSAINGETAYWMRFRVISVATPTSPIVTRIRIDAGGKQYIKQNVVQGTSQDETLGSSNATPNQEFVSAKQNFISGTDSLLVDGVAWTRVQNFLASLPTDRHYRVRVGDNDVATFVFGDGESGAIPSAGVNNVEVTYRYGANDDGNVGANAITVDKSGLSVVNRLWNPRPAVGWEEAQGSTPESLARAKIEGPASLRVRDIALGPYDAEILAVRASKIDSSVLNVSRARSIEEGFGPKTIELVVVPAGGGQASQQQLDDLSVFFNGDRFSSPVKKKRFVANQEITAVNYIPRPIDVTATVTAGTNVSAALIRAALTQLLQPEAKAPDGVGFQWEFGAVVPDERISHEIFKVDRSISKVALTLPSGDTVLAARELPVAGTLIISVIKG